MEPKWTIDAITWITAVEVPILAGLFRLIWRSRRESEMALDHAHELFEDGLGLLRDKLADYKLEVAKSYASIAYIKDVEKRLTMHLLRIESKLDSTPRADQGGRS